MLELLNDTLTYYEKVGGNPFEDFQTETDKILRRLNASKWLKYEYHDFL